MAYNNNVPLATQTKAQTQAPILNNFKYIETDLQVEHQFNTGFATEGVHKQCSMGNQSTPAVPAGCNGVYYVNGGNAFFTNGSNQFQLSTTTTTPMFTPFSGKMVFAGAGTKNILVGYPVVFPGGTTISGDVSGIITLFEDPTNTGSRMISFTFSSLTSSVTKRPPIVFATSGTGVLSVNWNVNDLAISTTTALTVRYSGYYMSLLNSIAP